MKYLFGVLIALLPIFGYGQAENTLSKLLWDRVHVCYSMFEDMDDDGIPDFDKIDDSKNGYLKISGGWPTCGCQCSSTVGAYKNQEGNYIILQSDKMKCSWERKISSNKPLKDILPPDFGISSFISAPIPGNIKHPVFFLDFDIPRIGTDTKVTIELVPFGLVPEGSEAACYEYKEEDRYSNCKSIWGLEDIVEHIQNDKTLDYLMAGNFDKISPADNKVIAKNIGDDDSRFKSKEEIQKTLIELKQIYTIYQMLDATEITLGWNRQDSGFYIKEKEGKPEKMTFREFLIKNEYWSPLC